MSFSQLRNLKYRRDVAIQALIKARRSHKKRSHLQQQVLAYVEALRVV